MAQGQHPVEMDSDVRGMTSPINCLASVVSGGRRYRMCFTLRQSLGSRGTGQPMLDPEHEDRALSVLRAAERHLGERRFGGGWIDRTAPSRPVIGVAAVDPSQRDVDAIDQVAREAGWPVQIVAVRYSRAELVALLESLDKTPRPGDAWVSLGWDARFNAILIELRRWDEEAVSWARERFPNDALMIVVHPGASWSAAFGDRVAPHVLRAPSDPPE